MHAAHGVVSVCLPKQQARVVLSASSLGFPGELRLKTADEFNFVFEKPCRSAGKSFTILARPNQRDYPRLGLIISKRCAKSAVKRNRLKRLIRESFRHSQEGLAGLDVVVIGKTMANTQSNSDLTDTLNRHWKELAKRCERS